MMKALEAYSWINNNNVRISYSNFCSENKTKTTMQCIEKNSNPRNKVLATVLLIIIWRKFIKLSAAQFGKRSA